METPEQKEKREIEEQKKAQEILSLFDGYTPAQISRILNHAIYLGDHHCTVIVPKSFRAPADL